MHLPTLRGRDFVARLQPYSDSRLVFEHDGQRILPGYHVTEIKAAAYRSLDCGARPQQWEETIVQLWDVADQPDKGHMSVRKFLGIWRKVDADVGLNGESEVKFEWGDAATPAVHYTFAGLRPDGDAVIVTVEPVRATCKPRDDWWLARQPAEASGASCCAPAAAGASGSSGCAPASAGAVVPLDAISDRPAVADGTLTACCG